MLKNLIYRSKQMEKINGIGLYQQSKSLSYTYHKDKKEIDKFDLINGLTIENNYFANYLSRYANLLKNVIDDIQIPKSKFPLSKEAKVLNNKIYLTIYNEVQKDNIRRNTSIKNQIIDYQQKYDEFNKRNKPKKRLDGISKIKTQNFIVQKLNISRKRQAQTSENSMRIHKNIFEKQLTEINIQNTIKVEDKQRTNQEIIFKFITPRISFLNYNSILANRKNYMKTKNDIYSNLANSKKLKLSQKMNPKWKGHSINLSNIFI